MEIIKLVFAIAVTVGAIFGGFVVYKGLNLKEPISWLFAVVAFLYGFVGGIVFGNSTEGLMAGAILAFSMLYCGAMVRRYRLKYKNRDK